jgi:hypothetical protein
MEKRTPETEATRRFDRPKALSRVEGLKAPSVVEGLTLAATGSGNRDRSGDWYPRNPRNPRSNGSRKEAPGDGAPREGFHHKDTKAQRKILSQQIFSMDRPLCLCAFVVQWIGDRSRRRALLSLGALSLPAVSQTTQKNRLTSLRLHFRVFRVFRGNGILRLCAFAPSRENGSGTAAARRLASAKSE